MSLQKKSTLYFDYVMYQNNSPTDEPFILSTQTKQVWYMGDPLEPSWKVVMKTSRRGNYDVYSRDPSIEPIFP